MSIALVLALAVIVEGLIQISKNVGNAFASKEWKTAVTQLFAMAIGIILCVSTGADIFKPLGITFTYPIIGVILTGLFASRGSNYVSDLVSKLQKASTTANIISDDTNVPDKVEKIADATQTVSSIVINAVDKAAIPDIMAATKNK